MPRRGYKTGSAAPAVREGLVSWVHHTGKAFPMQRLVQYEPHTEPAPEARGVHGDGDTERVTSNLFSGSPEAEERARAFDETPGGAGDGDAYATSGSRNGWSAARN